MKRYIAVLEINDDEEIIDASVSYVYRSNGTNYSTTASLEFKEESEDVKNKTYEDGLNDAWECARKIFVPVNKDGLSGRDVNLIFNNMEAPYNIFDNYSASEAIAKIKEYEEKQKEPVFKVGDRVRTTGDRDRGDIELFPVGTIGEVMEVDCDGDCLVMPYETYAAPYYYPADAIELANDVIVVGDEVYHLDANYRGVVTAVWKKSGVLKTETLTQSGKLSCSDAKDLHRTGRRFPEISNVLKKMQEGGK